MCSSSYDPAIVDVAPERQRPPNRRLAALADIVGSEAIWRDTAIEKYVAALEDPSVSPALADALIGAISELLSRYSGLEVIPF